MRCLACCDIKFFLSRRSAKSESALLPKREKIDRAWEALERKIGDAEENNSTWSSAAGHIERLKAIEVTGNADESGWRKQQQRFDDDEKGRDEYLELP